MRNTWALLREAGYPARGFASHMPQIINKSLATRSSTASSSTPMGRAYDEWSLYFNVAAQLYPAHFAFAPYATLGWPMRMGDWFPQVTPEQPAFENYYPENYEAGGMFAGLRPLGDLEAKTARTFTALAQAQRVERRHGQLVLVRESGRTRPSSGGPVVAGKENVRRILLINGAHAGAVKGQARICSSPMRAARSSAARR